MSAWPPHITVATVIQRDDEFLMVEETDHGQTVFNQPAGHLEQGESLLEAAVRETLEETAWVVTLTGFIGTYRYYAENNDTTYLRFCFSAEANEKRNQALDTGIVAAHWLRLDAIRARPQRSPLVLTCIEDALRWPPIPLERMTHV